MLALIATVFVASVMGSLHCAGMCGAFVAFALGTPGAEGMPSRAVLQAAYNGGRLVTYVALGAVAGAIGSMVNLGGAMVGVQRAAAVAAGAMMVGVGLIAMARVAGMKISLAAAPGFLQKAVVAGHRAGSQMTPVKRAAVIGLLTTLLPCGWLWAFVITAAGTGHVLWGAAAMGAFWLGTLPVLVGVGVGVQQLAPRLARRLPVVTALAIVAVGIYTIAGRAVLPAMASTVREKATAAQLEEQVKAVEQAELPCCAGKRAAGATQDAQTQGAGTQAATQVREGTR